MDRESITVALGDREFKVEALSIRESKGWRHKFSERLQPLLDILPTLPDVDITKPEELVKLTPVVQGLLTDYLDEAIEVLFEYSPALNEEREWIEDNATEKEAIAALMGVLKLANPFPLAGLSGVVTGPPTGPTSSKSASRSGASKRRSSKT